MPRDPTERFGDRVEEYARHRPGYPEALGDLLARECGLGPSCVAADIGSGTGKLTELLLPRAGRVYAVEPNPAMRRAAEGLLGGRPGFVSVDGRAEATGLADASIDLVTAAQACHWFDAALFSGECSRILRPRGTVALVWNERDERDSEFLRDYERFLLDCSEDYPEADHRRRAPREVIAAFFGAAGYLEAEFANAQDLDLAGLRGRYLSCSYALPSGDPRFGEAMDRLAVIFNTYQEHGAVRMSYRCRVYWGTVACPGPACPPEGGPLHSGIP